MRSNVIRGLQCVGVILVLAPLGRGDEFPVFDGAKVHFEWPIGLGDGVFGRAVACELNGDAILDAVVRKGDVAYALIGVGVYSVPVALDACTDFDVLRAAAPGEPDEVALVGSQGLRLMRLDGAASVAAMVSAEPDWVNARFVRCRDLDRDGDVDVVGVNAEGTTVRALLREGGSYTPGGEADLAAAATGVEIADCDGSGVLEIVAMAGAELSFVRLGMGGGVASVGMPSLSQPLRGDALAVLRAPGPERVAWVASDALGVQWLATVAASSAPTVVDLHDAGAELDVTSLSCAHIEAPYGDPDSDVLITHRLNHHGLLCLALPDGAFAFSTSTVLLVPVLDDDDPGGDPNLAPALDHAASDLLVDRDGDGDVDVIAFVESNQRVTAIENPIVTAAAFRLPVLDADRTFVDPQLGYGIRLQLDAPSATPAAATHVEVVLWRQADSEATLDAAGVARKVYSLAEGHWPLAVDFVLPETEGEFDAVYWFQIRTIELLEGDRIASAGPLAIFALTPRFDVATLLEQGANGPSIGVIDAGKDYGFVAVIVPRPDIPPPGSPPSAPSPPQNP